MRKISIFILTLCAFQGTAQVDCRKCGTKVLACYDIVVSVPKPTDPKELGDWENLHRITAAYISSIVSNEVKQCIKVLDMSSAKLHPGDLSSASVPPTEVKGETDYVLQGELTTVGPKVVASLRLSSADNEFVGGGTARFLKSDDIIAQGNKVATDLRADSKSLFDAIYNFEKKKRDDYANNTAFNPTITFTHVTTPLNKDGIKRDTAKTEEQFPVEICLKDCDDFPLNNRKILFSLNGKGKLLNAEGITDANGKVTAYYATPPEEGNAYVKMVYSFKHPSKRLDFVADSVLVKIIRPKSDFKAHLTVTSLSTKQEYDEAGIITNKTETEETYHAELMLKFFRDKYKISKETLGDCDGSDVCILLQGGSYETSRDGSNKKNKPIGYSVSVRNWSQCDSAGKQILTLVSTTEGTGNVTDYSVSSSINIGRSSSAKPAFVPAATVNSTDSSFKTVPGISGRYNIFMFINVEGLFPNVNSKATKPQSKQYDCVAKTWSVPVDEKYGLTVHDFDALHQSLVSETGAGISNYVRGLVFDETTFKAFNDNPTKGGKMKGIAYSYYRDSNPKNKAGIENEIELWVTLEIE